MKNAVCAALVTIALAGCGSGGGGGGGTIAPTPTPTPVAGGGSNNTTGGGGGDGSGGVPTAEAYPTMTTLNGQARVYTAIMSNGGAEPTRGQVTARADGHGNFTFTVNAITDAPAYTFTVGPNVSGLHTVPGTSCGNCFRTAPINTTGSDGGNVFGQIVYLDINGSSGMSYLSIGSWAVYEPGTRSGEAVSGGSGVVGVATRDADIPKTGTATYSGQFIGRLNDGPAGFSVVGATATSLADFGSGVVTINTTNTQRQFALNGEQALPGLDFSGSMNFLSSGGQRTNQLRGPVVTRSGIVGDANGAFYGPAAQELGGTVIFKPSFVGSFGMKKQ
jgi:transferrin binding protein